MDSFADCPPDSRQNYARFLIKISDASEIVLSPSRLSFVHHAYFDYYNRKLLVWDVVRVLFSSSERET